MATKKCTKCGEVKDVSEYWKHKIGKNGLRSDCKDCMKAYRKKSYVKENSRVSQRKYRKSNIDDINEKGRIYSLSHSKSAARYNTYAHQLTIIEEPRPSNDDNSLEVRCKYCGKYTQPTISQVNNRLKSLNGRGTPGSESHFYCSDECRDNCPLYRLHSDPKRSMPNGQRPVQAELRAMVLERDDNQCVKCGATENLICHHIDPVKIEPILSADMDNCITFCYDCDQEAHSQKGCGYGELRQCSTHEGYKAEA